MILGAAILEWFKKRTLRRRLVAAKYCPIHITPMSVRQVTYVSMTVSGVHLIDKFFCEDCESAAAVKKACLLQEAIETLRAQQ